MLDATLLQQVSSYFANLTATYTLVYTTTPQHTEQDAELVTFLTEFASTSPQLRLQGNTGDTLGFSLLRDNAPTGITFQCIPGGHEFTSLLLAILNADGQGKNLPDAALTARIQALQGPLTLTSVVSLTCTNCPDIVQALNIIALVHPEATHTVVDGALYPALAESLHVQAVPTVFDGTQTLHIGRGSLGELLDKLETLHGSNPTAQTASEHHSDLLIMGGGPAGVAAAIYAARKGLDVALVAQNIGGQVKETVAIENVISVPHTTGADLAASLRVHASEYSITLYENRQVTAADVTGTTKVLTTSSGETFTAPQLIVATGAKWRKLGIPGEDTYIGKGVAFCPHCDGPLFKDKAVAVIGGGNSGIEAAIDLAGICREVTVVEFLDTLKADKVLQEKVASLPNVTIYTATKTLQMAGDGERLNSLLLQDRTTEATRTIPVDGVFVQIGLMANTEVLQDQVQRNKIGEIEIDAHCRTGVPGVYAAGDCSSVPYNQIIIAMGEGAKASLAAFEDRMRNA